MPNELSIVNTQNLSTETIAKIDAQVDAFIAKHKENSVEINRIVFDGTAALVAGDNLAQNMGSHGKLKRFWRRFNGDNGRTQDTINANLIESQYAAQQTLEKLAEQNLLTFELIAAVNNSLNVQIEEVNYKIIDIKKKLVDFFSVAKRKIEDHEDRIQRLEHESELNHWATNIRVFEFNGTNYQDMDDTAKMICIVRDFLRLTGDKRYSVDFDYLKTAMITIGLKLNDKISYEKFILQLSTNYELVMHLLGGDSKLVKFATENEPILFILSKVNENNGRNFFHVQMDEISNVDLAFELLYNLEQVICAKKIAEKIKNAEMHKNRGDTYLEQEKYEQAIQEYDKAIELNPNFAKAYCNRGWSYLSLGEKERAIQDYSKAIALNPNLVNAYNERGIAYYGLGEKEQAINDYDKAINLNPNDDSAYFYCGVAYRDLGKYERAIQYYDKAIELNPNFAMAYNYRGHAYSKLGQKERAIQDFDKAIALNPNYAEAYNNRGVEYYYLKQYQKALRDFNKALELNPIIGLAKIYREKCLRAIGK